MKNFILFLTIITIFKFNGIVNAQEQIPEQSSQEQGDKVVVPAGFPLAVINMKKVLSQSTAAKVLRQDIEKVQFKYRSELETEEKIIKAEQEELQSKKSVLSEEQFRKEEEAFRKKVDGLQKKVSEINRNLESTMAKGMQKIQSEAVRQIAIISKERGYLMVFDTNAVVIAVEQINISAIVAKKLNETLPKIIDSKKNNTE